MLGKKIITTLIAVVLLFSAMVVINQVTEFKIIRNASASSEVTLSDNGSRTNLGLHPGQLIHLKVTDNSLNASERYYVKVGNISGNWSTVKIVSPSTAKSDDYGNLDFVIRVPGWYELDSNPIGEWNLTLCDKYGTNVSENLTINITNLYEVRYKAAGEDIDYLIYNKTYYSTNRVWAYVYNWTGIGSDLTLLDDENLNISLYAADGATLLYYHSGVTTGSADFAIGPDQYEMDGDNYEYYLWVNVTNEDFAAEVNTTSNASSNPLPVKLDLTTTLPTGVIWGQTTKFSVTVDVYDGQTDPEAISGYPIYVYAPVDGGYYAVKYGDTQADGSCTLNINPVTDMVSAGTWYVGTQQTGDYRINETDVLDIADFIQYGSFTVATRDTATVAIVNDDDLVKDFTQPVNVSVANSSSVDWDDDVFQNMNIHVTGIEVNFNGTEYSNDDVVLVKEGGGSAGDKKSYYEFDIVFLETSTTAKIWVSYPGNLTLIEGSNHTGESGTYSAKYGNDDLEANVTGSVTFSVVSPGAMSVFVDNIPEAVEITDAACGGGWVNKSAADGMWTNITVYGATETDHKNATVTVSGCGLDFTIEEDDTPDTNEYLLEQGVIADGPAYYNLSIIPKKMGTLIITVTNGTNTVEKDYEIDGLDGSVSTSIGDDLEITVGTTETITLSGASDYVWTTITFYNEDWVCQDLLNESEDAGDLSFNPEADDIDCIGYIVVVAGIEAYELYMYDIIEVVPVDDLTAEVVTPDAANQTLTVGLEQEIVVNLFDADGNPVTEGDPDMEAILIDADHDEDNPLQEFTAEDFEETDDGEFTALIQPWFAGQLVITGYNASTEIKHIGETTLDVDYATITYDPAGTTAGIGLENITVNVTGIDANGNPLSDITLYLYWNATEAEDLDSDTEVTLDEDGIGSFDITIVGDNKTTINATLEDNDPEDGNRTLEVFSINFPVFEIVPADKTIYVQKANLITVTANDYAGEPLEGIWLTFTPTYGEIAAEPDPIETDEEGMAMFSINPSSSGTLNLTIVKDIDDRDEDVTTDTYLTATYEKELTIIATSPVYKGDTVTVTIKSGTSPVADVAVTFVGTATTDADGEVTFDLSDIDIGNADSAIYEITAEKAGYITATKSITVINKFDIIIVISDEVKAGGEFTATIIAGGQPLAGATVTFEGTSKTSNGNGIVTFTAPEEGPYTITATCTGYIDGTLEFDVLPGTPGFELLTLIVAIGIAFILLRRRRKQ